MTLNEWVVQHRETLIDNPYLLGYLSETYTSDEITAFDTADIDTILCSIAYFGYVFRAIHTNLRTALRETKTGSAIVSIAELLAKVQR